MVRVISNRIRMSKPQGIGRWTGFALAALAMCGPCPGAMQDAPREYRAPQGFNGLAWGDPLSGLGGARLARVNTVVDAKGKVTRQRCIETGGCANWVASDQDVEGEGSFAVAEYYRESDSNPWASSLVALQAATYLFCDEWQGASIPRDVKQQLRHCGARIFYRSETAAQIMARPSGAETNHDRVLRHLLREHGPPDGYRVRRGEVTVGALTESGAEIESAAGTEEAAPERSGSGVLRYRWCGLQDSAPELLPACTATITLLFNRDTGWGMVLLVTDAVYKFAQARHATKDENNELYMALVSAEPAKPTRRRANDCMRTTGSLVCGGKLTTLSDRELQRFEP